MDLSEYQTLDEVGEDAEDETPTYYQKTSLASVVIDKITDTPLVGLQYVLEVRADEETEFEKCYYVCSLCSKKMSSATFIAHVKSVPHRLKFAENHSSEIYAKYGSIQLKQWTSALVKEFTEELTKLEYQSGRHKMAVANEKEMSSALVSLKEKLWDMAAISKAESKIKSALSKSAESSSNEKPAKVAPSARNSAVPSSKGKCNDQNYIHVDTNADRLYFPINAEQPKKDVSRSLTLKAENEKHSIHSRDVPKSLAPKAENEKHSIHSRDVPKSLAPKAENEKQSVHSRDAVLKPSFAKAENDKHSSLSRGSSPRSSSYRRDGRSPKRRRSSSPKHPRIPSPGRQRVPEIGQQPRSRESSRRPKKDSKSRSRSPLRRSQFRRSRSRSRSPRRKDHRAVRSPARRGSPRRSPPRSPRRHRIQDRDSKVSKDQKIEDYLYAEKRAIESHTAKVKKYADDVESHPKYLREWRDYWEKRSQELVMQRKDPSYHDFKNEWAERWRRRLKELCDADLEETLDLLRKRYQVTADDIKGKKNSENAVDGSALTTDKQARSPSPWEDETAVKRTSSSTTKTAGKEVRGLTSRPAELESAKKTVYESELSVIGTLTILNELEDQLGSFGPAVSTLLTKAQELVPKKEDALNLFSDSDNLVLIQLAKEKLDSQVSAGVLGTMARAQTQKAVECATWLHSEAEKLVQKKKSEEEKEKYLGLDIDNIASATLGMNTVEIAQYIAQCLHDVGKSDASEENLQQILLAVSGKHASLIMKRPSSTASKSASLHLSDKVTSDLTVESNSQQALPQNASVGTSATSKNIPAVENSTANRHSSNAVTQSSRNRQAASEQRGSGRMPATLAISQLGSRPVITPEVKSGNKVLEKSQLSKPSMLFPSGVSVAKSKETSTTPVSKSGGLNLLKSAYDESGVKDMEKLSLEELQSLLSNFRSLSTEEQTALTQYLKKLEATDSRKVTKLREIMQKSYRAAQKEKQKATVNKPLPSKSFTGKSDDDGNTDAKGRSPERGSFSSGGHVGITGQNIRDGAMLGMGHGSAGKSFQYLQGDPYSKQPRQEFDQAKENLNPKRHDSSFGGDGNSTFSGRNEMGNLQASHMSNFGHGSFSSEHHGSDKSGLSYDNTTGRSRSIIHEGANNSNFMSDNFASFGRDKTISGGKRDNLASGGGFRDFYPVQGQKDFVPSQVSGNLEGQERGDFVPGQGHGSFGIGQGRGNFGTGQGRGNFGTGQGRGNFGPGQDHGDLGPRQDGDFGPGKGHGNFSSGQGRGELGSDREGGNFGLGWGRDKFASEERPGDFGPHKERGDFGSGHSQGNIVSEPKRGDFSQGHGEFGSGQGHGAFGKKHDDFGDMQGFGNLGMDQDRGDFVIGQRHGESGSSQRHSDTDPGKDGRDYGSGPVTGNFGAGFGRSDFGSVRGRGDFGQGRGRGDFGQGRGRGDFGKGRGRGDSGLGHGHCDFSSGSGSGEFGPGSRRGGFSPGSGRGDFSSVQELGELGSGRGRGDHVLSSGNDEFGSGPGHDDFGKRWNLPDHESGNFAADSRHDDFGSDHGRKDFGSDHGRKDFGSDRGLKDFGSSRGHGNFGQRGFGPGDSGPLGHGSDARLLNQRTSNFGLEGHGCDARSGQGSHGASSFVQGEGGSQEVDPGRQIAGDFDKGQEGRSGVSCVDYGHGSSNKSKDVFGGPFSTDSDRYRLRGFANSLLTRERMQNQFSEIRERELSAFMEDNSGDIDWERPDDERMRDNFPARGNFF